MGSSSPSTVMTETPLPRTGDCFLTAEKEGYVTYWTHPQHKREHGVGAFGQPWFVPAQNVLERTADRCSIAPALGYLAFIGVRHDPSLFVCHDAARNSSRPHSKGRRADQGRVIQDKLDWKDTLFATKAPPVHSHSSQRSIAAPLDCWATYASAAEKSSGEVTATSEELAKTLHKVPGRRREMWPCHPLPAGRKPAPLCRCPSGRHRRSQQRQQPRFSRLSLNGCSERVAEFGGPYAEQGFPVGGSRSCSCVADNSGVIEQNRRRSLQRG
ncbi:uncharacterized protein LOC142776501 [Rhipicephalus microplus]|uniref:uncharacterized protein LOC142776501 n=1 Tax=Rhipicephalus microplus TaxID=6941 RepID=UPI003F6C1E3F